METRKYTYITEISSPPQLTPNYKHILFGGSVFTATKDSMYETISTIYQPNQLGLDCNFVMHTDTVINIPNFGSCFANFRLGALKGRCDTIVSGINVVKTGRLKVYPNPASDFFTVEIPDSLSDIVFELFDASGRIILQEHIRHTVQRIHTTGLSGGLYYYRALSAGVLNGKGLLILDKSK